MLWFKTIATLICTFVIFLEAVLRHFPTSSEYEFEVAIKNWLCHAPARIDPDEDEQQEVVNDDEVGSGPSRRSRTRQ